MYFMNLSKSLFVISTFFGNYEKRINYVKDLNLAPPKMTDDWRYLQNPKCDESNIISCYIDSLHSLSFFS